METIWLEASAGAGKTTFLINQLQMFCNTKFNNQNAMFLTFSNAATNEMHRRLIGFSNISISTLHALAYKIILENQSSKKIVQENYVDKVIVQMLQEKSFAELIDLLIEKKINIFAEAFDEFDNAIRQRIKTIIQQREEELKIKNGVLYYDDLILHAIDILQDEKNYNVFCKYFSNIRLLLLDESQDLSTKQWELILTILKEWKERDGLFVVAGDPKQLIYDFQGANIKDFYYYKEQIKCISDIFEEKKFHHTYRFSQNHCDYLNKIFKSTDDFDYIQHLSVHNKTNELASVKIIEIKNYSELIELINEKKINNLNEIMLIYRQVNQNIIDLAHDLFSSGFLLNSPFVGEHPIIKDFRYLLHWLIFRDDFSFAIISKHSIEFCKKQNFNSEMNSEEIFFQWIEDKKVDDFLNYKLQKAKDFWIEILRRYAAFYQYDLLAAIHDCRFFYKEHYVLFEDGIFFNTIHASKGKEAEYVFLLNTDYQGKFAGYDDRLLYVALTRSKKELIIPIINNTIAEKKCVKRCDWTDRLMEGIK